MWSNFCQRTFFYSIFQTLQTICFTFGWMIERAHVCRCARNAAALWTTLNVWPVHGTFTTFFIWVGWVTASASVILRLSGEYTYGFHALTKNNVWKPEALWDTFLVWSRVCVKVTGTLSSVNASHMSSGFRHTSHTIGLRCLLEEVYNAATAAR